MRFHRSYKSTEVYTYWPSISSVHDSITNDFAFLLSGTRASGLQNETVWLLKTCLPWTLHDKGWKTSNVSIDFTYGTLEFRKRGWEDCRCDFLVQLHQLTCISLYLQERQERKNRHRLLSHWERYNLPNIPWIGINW